MTETQGNRNGFSARKSGIPSKMETIKPLRLKGGGVAPAEKQKADLAFA